MGGAMTMAGISPGLFWAGALAMVVFTGLVWWRLRAVIESGPGGYFKLDLLLLRPLRAWVKWRPFQFVAQVPFVAAFLFILAAGFLGTRVTYLNIAPILTWTIWWTGLIFVLLLFGKVWCLVCPWNAIAMWVQRASLWARRRDTLSLSLRWPRRLRNIYIATGLFLGLTWLELGFGITTIPWATAALGILILAMALVSALYFQRQAFCRYACLVGRVSGLYAMFAPVELRARDKDICRQCETQDCFRGNRRGYPCPTFEFLGTMEINTYCILCSECVKSCPHDNVALNLRPFATDLLRSRRQRADEAYLAIVMLSMTSFHGFTMTPAWHNVHQSLVDLIGFRTGAGIVAFTLLMAGILALPILLWAAASGLARFASGTLTPSVGAVFIGFAYALLPLALLYHLAHNTEHLLQEGQRIVYLVSDPFGWGWNLLGTAQWRPGSPVSLSAIRIVQVAMLVVGQGMAAYIAHPMAVRLFPQRRQAVHSLAVVTVFMLGFSLANLWLLAQPMYMRSTM